jgi:hypothetical protein
MPQISIAKDVIAKAYGNYLSAILSESRALTIYMDDLKEQADFYKLVGMTEAQVKRLHRKAKIKVNRLTAKRIEILSGERGYVMLKVHDARMR